jgi:hypothetical protein
MTEMLYGQRYQARVRACGELDGVSHEFGDEQYCRLGRILTYPVAGIKEESGVLAREARRNRQRRQGEVAGIQRAGLAGPGDEPS